MPSLNLKQVLVQHICTTNDTNGNPRRLWLVITNEGTVALDEGYEGGNVYIRYLKEHWSYLDCSVPLHLPTIEVKPAEYKRLLKDYKVEDSNE